MLKKTVVLIRYKGQIRTRTWADRRVLKKYGLPEFFGDDSLNYVKTTLKEHEVETVIQEEVD